MKALQKYHGQVVQTEDGVIEQRYQATKIPVPAHAESVRVAGREFYVWFNGTSMRVMECILGAPVREKNRIMYKNVDSKIQQQIVLFKAAEKKLDLSEFETPMFNDDWIFRP